MKRNCNEKDNELLPNRHAQRHTNEDAVEQNPHLEQHALQQRLLMLLLRRQRRDAFHRLVLALFFRHAPHPPRLRRRIFLTASLTQIRQPTTNAIRPPIPRPQMAQMQALPSRSLRRPPLPSLPLPLLILTITNHTTPPTPHPLQPLSPTLTAQNILLLMPMHMPPRRKHHLDRRDEENRQQTNRAGHGLVVLCPKIRQAGVAQRREGRRQQVHEGRREQHARAEVAGAEEERGQAPAAAGGPRCSGSSGRGRRARSLAVQGESEQREGAGEGGDEEDDEEGCDVEGRVVGGGGAAVGPGAGGCHGWLVVEVAVVVVVVMIGAG